jgi:hypothetical protein
MKVIGEGFGGRKTPSIGLVLGAGGVVGQAYQAGVLWPRCSARPAGTRAAPPSSSARRPARSPVRHCASACRPPTWRPRSTGCPPPGEAAPSSGASSPPTPSRCPTPSVRSLLRPWNVPSHALIARAARRPLGLPPRGGGHDPAAARAGRHLRAGPRPRRAHRCPLAQWPADLRGPPVRRGPRRLRPPGRAAGAPGPAVLASCAIPGYFRRSHRWHRVRRRWRALGHQRRRAAVRRVSTWLSSSPPCRPPTAAQTGPTASGAAQCTGAWSARSPAPASRRRGDQPGARRRVTPGHGAAGHGRGPEPAVIEAAYEETREQIRAHPLPRPRWATRIATASAG